MKIPLKVQANPDQIAERLAQSAEDLDYDHFSQYSLRDNFVLTLESFEGGFTWVLTLEEVLEDSFEVKHRVKIASATTYTIHLPKAMKDRVTTMLLHSTFLEFV